MQPSKQEGGIRDCRDTGKEGSGLLGYMKGGIRDLRDSGLVGYRKGGIRYLRDSGLE